MYGVVVDKCTLKVETELPLHGHASRETEHSADTVVTVLRVYLLTTKDTPCNAPDDSPIEPWTAEKSELFNCQSLTHILHTKGMMQLSSRLLLEMPMSLLGNLWTFVSIVSTLLLSMDVSTWLPSQINDIRIKRKQAHIKTNHREWNWYTSLSNGIWFWFVCLLVHRSNNVEATLLL